MAEREANLMRRLMVAVGKRATVFRNHVGAITDANGYTHRFGLCVGSSDLIGWTTRTITPDMVGQRVAVFTAIEVKTLTGRTTPAQEHFLETVHRAGGIAIVARSEDDLARLAPPVPANPNLSP
jgi:hypothetical protein